MTLERAEVISLARRLDRRAEMDARWAGLVELHYFDAVDGATLPLPSWWKRPVGAYGCYLSHMSLLEASEGRVFVMEDDAVPGVGVASVLSQPLPEDGWDVLYLGGQHDLATPPFPRGGKPRLFRAEHVSRTHAYVVREAQQVAQLLRDSLRQGLHVDEVLAYSTLRQVVYHPFQVGQGAGSSDIWEEERGKDEFWN